MTPLSIVEHFDVIEDVGPRQFAGFVDAFADSFLFERAKEGLCDSVDAPMSTNALNFVQIANY